MVVRWKKTPDGVVLAVVRDDGSTAVQRTRHGGFFGVHDLLHYAVETTLGFDEAFFGMLAAGRGFDGVEAGLSTQALWAEQLVGVLTLWLRDGAWADADLAEAWAAEVNQSLAATFQRSGLPTLVVSSGDLARIGRLHAELAARWAGVKVGEHFELEFGLGGLDRHSRTRRR